MQVCSYRSQLSFIPIADDDEAGDDVLPPLPQFPNPELQQSDEELVMGCSEPHDGNHGQEHSEASSSGEGDSYKCVTVANFRLF